MRGQMRNEWLALVLASASAGAALLLCAIGIYGLLAQSSVAALRHWFRVAFCAGGVP